MFILIENSLQSTSILQWNTEDTTLQIHTRSYLHPKAVGATRAVYIKIR